MNKMIEIDGKPIDNGQTCTVDNVVQEFKIRIRSLGGLSPNAVKDQLQKMWEVLGVVEVECVAYVRAGMSDF